MRDFITKVDNTAPADSGILKAEEDNVRFEEMEKIVQSSGIVLDPFNGPDIDKAMLAQAAARYASGGVFFKDTSTTENQHTLVGVGNFVIPKAYFEGMVAMFRPGATNTGNSTLNINGIGAKPVKLHDGSGLTGGELASSTMTAVRYDPASGDDGEWLIFPWAIAQDGGGGGEANTASNVGSEGTGIYKEKNGVDLRFRKLRGINGISVTQDGDNVVLDAAGVSGSILPFYPHVDGAGTLSITNNGGGFLEVDAGQTFVHRGLSQISTNDYTSGQRQVTTAASKTYHLRWTLGGGFALTDVTAVDETLPEYDSDFDDMLIARIVTDGSNVPTITPLINKNNHQTKVEFTGGTPINSGQNGSQINWSTTWNLARTPIVNAMMILGANGTNQVDNDYWSKIYNQDRYEADGNIQYDYSENIDIAVHAIMLGG